MAVRLLQSYGKIQMSQKCPNGSFNCEFFVNSLLELVEMRPGGMLYFDANGLWILRTVYHRNVTTSGPL